MMNLREPNPEDVATLKRWRWRPVEFVRELFHVEPDLWQAEALALFPYNPRLAMKACKGPGKTTVLAWIAWNFLTTRPQPKIGATSISEDNISDNLWPEMSKWQGSSALLMQQFTWTKTRIFYTTDPANWFMALRTWPRTADPQRQADTLAGLHADYILFILDESGSIPQAVMITAEAILASCVEGHVVQAGNPTSLEGPLYRACVLDAALWKVIEITGDPEDPKRSPRISVEWAQQQIDSYGRDNPWVMVNVLGKFPPSSLNALLGVEEVNAAMHRKLVEEDYRHQQKRLGCDVARYGDDRTVIFPRQGNMVWMPKVMRHARHSSVSVDIATAMIRAKTKWGSELEFMDATGGWAAGARDIMVDAGYTVHEVQFAGDAIDPRYYNRRAEIWFNMAKAIQTRTSLPLIPEMIPELVAPMYWFRKGKFQLEEKEQIKARIGKSPDLADALATTYALPEMPALALEQLRGSSRARRDPDPYAIAVETAERDADPWK